MAQDLKQNPLKNISKDSKNMPETYWRQELTPEQYEIVRKKSTEAPFTGVYLDNKEKGVYKCVACGASLFSSDTKYDSGSGWPSFYDVINVGAVDLKEDKSYGVKRTEVICKNCGGHLGHVFDDGPQPTCQRYCINSSALDFDKENKGDANKTNNQ